MTSIREFNKEWRELIENIPYLKMNNNEISILKRKFEKDRLDIIKNNDELSEVNIFELINELEKKLNSALEQAHNNYKKNADYMFINNLKEKIKKLWNKIN